jgi:hypothetical protein
MAYDELGARTSSSRCGAPQRAATYVTELLGRLAPVGRPR